jgi:hypothetical protein
MKNETLDKLNKLLIEECFEGNLIAVIELIDSGADVNITGWLGL